MITHIVLFKLVDPANKTRAREVLLSMRGKIPVVRHLEVGVDMLKSPRSYDIALIVKFDSIEHLHEYQEHPVHVEISNYMTLIRESSISVDYHSEK